MTEWEPECRNEKTFSVWIGRWDSEMQGENDGEN